MPVASYEKLNPNMVLDLPFFEGDGVVLHDVSTVRSNVDLIHTPVWTAAGNASTLVFDGNNDYGDASNGSTTDLSFTSVDYSIGLWMNYTRAATTGSIIGRYELNIGGWELYVTDNVGSVLVTLRHHHSLTAVGTGVHPGHHRSACYSSGWTMDEWQLVGISRTGGGSAKMYRNGVSLDIVDGGIIDPETTDHRLSIGVRDGDNGSFFGGGLWWIRVWNKLVTEAEWLDLYNKEVGLLA